MRQKNNKLIEPLGLIGGFALLTLIGYLIFQIIRSLPFFLSDCSEISSIGGSSYS